MLLICQVAPWQIYNQINRSKIKEYITAGAEKERITLKSSIGQWFRPPRIDALFTDHII